MVWFLSAPQLAEVRQSAMVNRAKRPDRRHLLAAVRHPARRDGVIALVLFVLPWVALAPTRRHHLDVSTQAVIFGLGGDEYRVGHTVVDVGGPSGCPA
jgi:hypothetical protein